MKYFNRRIALSRLVLSISKTDQMMELVSEWFPDSKFRKLIRPYAMNMNTRDR